MIGLPGAWTLVDRAWALPAAPAIALLGAAAILLLHARPNARDGAALVAGLVLAALVAGLWPHAGADLRFELWTWVPGLSLAFALEPIGLLFATVAATLWPVTTLFSIGYMRGNREAAQTRFYFYFAIALASAIAIAFAANLVTLFIGYEVLTLSTWPLVAHRGGEDARRGGRTYLAVLLATSIALLLPAIVWTHVLAGTTTFERGGILAGRASHATLGVLFALYLFGIGKAALMPFHRWLPAAMVAPAPVSALLHAVAVVKAGVFCVLKVSVYVFGLEPLRVSGAADPMMWVAAFTLLAASVVALNQDNLKARLAYSTVSQLGYIVLGATLATGTAVAGGALHIATHAVAKITLFFCAGAIYLAAHKTLVSELDGLGRAMPFTFGAFLIASLSIVGLPPLAGTWSKWLLMMGASTADPARQAMVGVLMVSALLNVAYLVTIPVRAFFRPPPGAGRLSPLPDGDVTAPRPGLAEAPWPCVAALCLTALACVALFFVSDRLLEPVAWLMVSTR